MSKTKEKLLKKQADKQARIEEKIKNGIIRRVAYEDRKKKPAIPNHLSPFETPEEELEDRQETVEKAVMVYYRMLSNLLPKLSRIKDPRKPGMIKHKMKVLLVYGILMSMYQIGSRRKANQTISRPVFFDNLKAMFPEFDTLPHADTVARLLEKLDASQIYGWDYMIVLKQDSMPSVWKEALALMKINQENRLKCYWGDREQIYAWANWIEYEYLAGEVKKKETLNVVVCYETWKEKHSRSSGVAEEKQTRYAWLSSREINHKNVFFRCTKKGRYRWKLENNILVEKHQGYEYEHCFSYSWKAMKGFHYLMKIGHFLNVLALNSELLADKVRELGIRGFINYLTLACTCSKLDKNRIKEARERKFMWKLELVA